MPCIKALVEKKIVGAGIHVLYTVHPGLKHTFFALDNVIMILHLGFRLWILTKK